MDLRIHQPARDIRAQVREQVIEQFERLFLELVQRITLPVRAQVDDRAQLVNLLQMLLPAAIHDL